MRFEWCFRELYMVTKVFHFLQICFTARLTHLKILYFLKLNNPTLIKLVTLIQI